MGQAKAEIRREIWERKKQLLISAVESKGLTLSFESRSDRESFRNFLFNFRQTVTNNKTKYPEEWALFSAITIIRHKDTQLLLAPASGLSDNEKSLLQITDNLT